jgi:hypothetical protein
MYIFYAVLPSMGRAVVLVLVGVVAAVVVAVAGPQSGDALAVAADKLVAVVAARS